MFELRIYNNEIDALMENSNIRTEPFDWSIYCEDIKNYSSFTFTARKNNYNFILKKSNV